MVKASPTSDHSDDGAPSASADLIRGLGLWAAIAIVIGSVIGQSIFLVGSDMARILGSSRAVITAWIVGGIVALFGSFCYAELGAAMPEAGGDYVYINRGLSPLLAYLFGWTNATMVVPALAAVIAAGFLRFAGFLLPASENPILTIHLGLIYSTHKEFAITAGQPIAAGLIAFVTAINYFGVRTAGRLQIVLTVLKVGLLLAIIVAGMAPRISTTYPTYPTYVPAVPTLAAFLTALVPAMLAYSGFPNLGIVGGEIANPNKNLPRAAIAAILLIIALYVGVNAAYFRLIGLSGVAHSRHLASDALQALMGSRVAKWITVGMMVSAFGSLHAHLLAGPRIPFAMARDGSFFRFANWVHPTFRSPAGAVLFQGALAVVLVLTGTYEDLYSLFMFSAGIFHALTAAALIRLRRSDQQLSRPYRAWGYPWTALIFGGVSAAMSINLCFVRPVRSLIGLAVVVVGIPLYYYWRKHKPALLSCS